MYHIDDYHYEIPKGLVSHRPVKNRDESRLLLMNRKNGQVSHHFFDKIVTFLNSSDVLVINDTKVIPARIIGKKKTGGKVEFLILNFDKNRNFLSPSSVKFNCLAKSSKALCPGSIVTFESGLEAIVLNLIDRIYRIKFNSGTLLRKEMYKFGLLPIPPYIKNHQLNNKYDSSRYQTIYAEKEGAIAAPTAGLHFTKKILNQLESRGIKIVKITLHVGYGSFMPVKVKKINHHKMHSEWYTVSRDSANTINKAKADGNRVVAVGTTSVRTLEFLAQKNTTLKKADGYCDLFIYPGYKFKVVDAIITNFHFPCSTLLMLVSAFSRKDFILEAYKIAINKKYRFFSYGDAMFIY